MDLRSNSMNKQIMIFEVTYFEFEARTEYYPIRLYVLKRQRRLQQDLKPNIRTYNKMWVCAKIR